MNYPYQNNQQLPFPADRIVVPFIQGLSLNNPPYVPNNYQGPQWMGQMLPVVAAAAAIEIQNKANTNPLRMFMFNQMASNSFANQDFDMLVRLIADCIIMQISSNAFSNVEQALPEVVPRICEMFCASNTMQFRVLCDIIGQQTMNMLQGTINEFRTVCESIDAMKRGVRANNYQAQPMQNNMGWNGQQPQQSVYGGNQPMQGMLASSGGSLFSAPTRMIPNNSRPSAGGGKYNNDRPTNMTTVGNIVQTPIIESPPMPVQQPFQPRTVMTNEVIRSEVLASGSDLEWKPFITKDSKPNECKKQYYPAHNPLTQNVTYLVDGQRNIVDVCVLEKDEPVMDQERHKVSTVFGKLPVDLKLRNPKLVDAEMSAGVAGVNNIAELLTAGDAGGIAEINQFIDPEVRIECALSDAWISLYVRRLLSAGLDDKVGSVYRGYYLVSELVLDKEDNTDMLGRYRDTDSFIELRDLMKSTVNDVGIEFWTRCNCRMTKLINSLIREEMGIPVLQIDSFVDDIEELIDYLGEQYGDTFKFKFLRYEAGYIKTVMYVMNDEWEANVVGLSEGYLATDIPDETLQPKVTYLSTLYTLTYIDCTAFELKIDLTRNLSSVVDRKVSPLLDDLLNGLFEDLKFREAEFSKCLIKTKDGRILSATKGLLDESCKLLTLVE